MNYKTKNKNMIKNMKEIFGYSSDSKLVNITADYSQGRRLTSVTVQIDGYPLYHSLILIYNRSVQMYDVLKYKNHTVFKLGQLTQLSPQIDEINRFILKKVPHSIPQASRELNEDSGEIDTQIDILKAENKMLKDKLESYRSQMKSLRDKIALMNNKMKLLRKNSV